MTQPEALRLAEQLDAIGLRGPVATELRRLHEENQRCRNVCDATSEGWRADAEEWKAQRDQLLKALNAMLTHMGMDEDEIGRSMT